jgi:hypothetical protein
MAKRDTTDVNQEVDESPDSDEENQTEAPAREPLPDTNHPDFYERPVPLVTFAQANAWYTDKNGNRVAAMELMGGFVHKMALLGRYADRESRYREAFEDFCRS